MTSPPDYQNTPRQPKASLVHPENWIPQTNGPSLPPESSRSRETVRRSALKTSGSLPNESSLQDQGDDTPTSQSSSSSTSPPESLQESRQRIQIGSPPSLTEGPPGLPVDTRRRLTSRGGSADLRDTSSERLEERFGDALESPTNVTGGKSTVNLQEESTLSPHTSPQDQHTSDYVPSKNGPTALQDTSGSPPEVKSSHGSSTTLNEPSKPLATPPQGQTHPRGLARHPAKAIIQPPSALRSSGTRMPRKGKVQWGHSDEPETSEFGRTHHMLDEKGLDHERFRELTKALERHSAATPLRKVHVYSPQSSSPASLEESSGSGLSSRDDTDFFSSSNAATLPLPQTTHEVPENLIGEDEDGGLPGTKDLRRFSLKKAEDVVNARLHRKPGWLPSKSRSRRRQLVEPLPQREVDVDDADLTGDITDVEGPEAGAAFPGNRGILSTLLDLYQHPEDNMSSASSASSRTSSSDKLWNRAWNQSSSSDFSRFIPRGPRLKPPALPKNVPRGFHIPSLKQLPEKLGITTRPAAARSAGGVFGPLIASTGNLTGVAAPYSSRLQPNVKRPGYGLSRYEIETKPPPGPKRGSEGVPTTPPPSLDEIGRSSSSESMFRLRSPADRYHAHKRPGMRSGYNTPRPGSPVGEDEKRPPASSPFYRRNKRRKAEVFITRHVAQIIFREEFIMKLTRAMMMFGGPPHRLQSQIMSAARVLDMQLSALYLPDVVLLSFDDSGTGTSHIKFIRQGSALNIEKLTDAFRLYWKVIHDKLSVCDASVSLDVLMKKKPSYGAWYQIFIGGMCSASICTVSFGGSFVDALVSFPLGALLVVMQMISFRNVLFSYTFEVIATLTFSFISAALAATHKLCYSALTSSSVVLILPGFLVLTGALELMSRNIVPGSVRLLYSVVYALFLGFGFSIGAEFYELFTSHQVYGAEDYTCSLTHNPLGPWYQRTPSTWWAFLTVPMFSFFLSMRNQCPWWRKEMLLLVAIACVGWVTNYWTGRRFKGQSDIIAGVGAFAVGLISNAYARIFSGNAFVVMITGILFQLPSGLGSGGLLSYASQEAQGSAESYVSGFRTALKLVSVSIGLTIGLGLSLVLTHPIQSRKREAGIFSL
ncbi:hypothetical protein CPB84DRAFT_1847098 [Gymnopilus junonius]|uniref:Pheromone-regulated membrane protein 10 n=1 Tax=Gymnopilus junonius TaxID=109634 RepID=A0A9P5NQT9_GYMJU|nr:hypothetical protein CPB84DRAFT_1847098 [Gymnopilus junonius]